MTEETKQAQLAHQYLADLYLDWFNNFLSIEAFAAHNGITEEHAQALIDLGKYYHENGSIWS